MKVKYTQRELREALEVSKAERSDAYPIYVWARAVRILATELKLLQKAEKEKETNRENP